MCWEEGVKVVFCRNFSMLMLMMMMRMVAVALRVLCIWLGRVRCLLVDMVVVIVIMVMVMVVVVVMTFVGLHVGLAHRTTQGSQQRQGADQAAKRCPSCNF